MGLANRFGRFTEVASRVRLALSRVVCDTQRWLTGFPEPLKIQQVRDFNRTGRSLALLWVTAGCETNSRQVSQGYEVIMWVVYFLMAAVLLIFMMSLFPAPPARR